MTDFNKLLIELNNLSNKVVELIPEISYIGNPVLRTKTETVSLEEGLEVGKKLMDTLLRYRQITGLGRGLASTQIGISSSVFVTYVDDIAKIYINPELLSSSEEKNTYKENCISSNHIWCDVRRPKSITLKYMNEKGESVSGEYTDFLARLIQHEYDHLQGIVNIDKAVMETIDYRFGNPKDEKLRD